MERPGIIGTRCAGQAPGCRRVEDRRAGVMEVHLVLHRAPAVLVGGAMGQPSFTRPLAPRDAGIWDRQGSRRPSDRGDHRSSTCTERPNWSSEARWNWSVLPEGEVPPSRQRPRERRPDGRIGPHGPSRPPALERLARDGPRRGDGGGRGVACRRSRPASGTPSRPTTAFAPSVRACLILPDPVTVDGERGRHKERLQR